MTNWNSDTRSSEGGLKHALKTFEQSRACRTQGMNSCDVLYMLRYTFSVDRLYVLTNFPRQALHRMDCLIFNLLHDPSPRVMLQVIDLGGLYVVGTSRHESRRVDNQLRGRAGRQGDPGATRFFLSLDDDIFRYSHS